MEAASSDLRVSERYGNQEPARQYMIIGDTVRRVNKLSGNTSNRIIRVIKEVFLPQGYPDSVSEDYLPYQLWDTLQAFCSYITGTLATHAMLKGVGVGDSSASPMAATITWILKDGLGMIGRILFAWSKGSDLDCNAKRWRLFADILNDVAIFIELLAPLFPSIFLAIACAASISKSIVGVAGGATRAALVQHQARRDNMADVSAKDGSQETLVNLMGLIVGLVITPLVAGRTGLVWFLFAIFTCLHLFANYRAVSVVSMETLNRSRLHLLMKLVLSTGAVSTPHIINRQEPILRGLNRQFLTKYGVSIEKVLTNSKDYIRATSEYSKGKKCILNFSQAKKQTFHTESSPFEQLKAAMAAELLEYISTYGDSPYLTKYELEINRVLTNSNDVALVSLCQNIMDDIFPSLHSQLQSTGWVTSHHLLGLNEWRYSFS